MAFSRRRRRALSPETRRTIEEIYDACDEEFGTQFREEATERARELVENYEADKPTTPVQGLRLMRRAYAEVAARHEPKEEPGKRTVPAETAPRGLSLTDIEDSEEFPPGPLDQIRADVAKKIKGKTWKRDAFAEE